MKRLGLIFVLGIIFLTSLCNAQVPIPPVVSTSLGSGAGAVIAYESLSITNSAVPMTAATYTTAANKAFCTHETAEIRWRIDGTAPTSGEGHLLEPGQTLTLIGYGQIALFQAIRTTSTSGTLKCTYLK